MKLQTFLEKLCLLAETPNALGKIRGLLLYLAVNGKLVHQDPNDVPASTTVELVREEAYKAIREGIIRRHGLPERPDESELPEIPSGWLWSRIAEITRPVPYAIKRGPFGSAIRKDMFVPEGFKVYEQQHAISGDFTKGRYFINDQKFEELRAFELYPNEILISCSGTVGKVAIVPEGIQRGIINQALLKISLHQSALLNEYFLILFPAFFMETDTLSNLQGTAQKNIPGMDILREMPFPLPPLAEQKRIVAKVDELMALCNRLEQQQQERDTKHAVLSHGALARFFDAPTPANLNFIFHKSYTIFPSDLRKSILSLAVQGKLIHTDPTDEAVEDLLAINDKRRHQTANSDHRADVDRQPILSAEDRWPIPDTWSWRGLADLVLFVDYRGKTPVKVVRGVRLLTAKNVRKGEIKLSPEEFLSEEDYPSWMTRGFPKVGDVLFTTEAPMGNAAVVRLKERFALAQRVICFQTFGALDPDFLTLQILSDQFQFILDKNGTGVTAKGIKASKLKQLPIAIPPLAEQRRIVAKVEQLMALVNRLETQLTTSRATAEKLMEAMVYELTAESAACGNRSFVTE